MIQENIVDVYRRLQSEAERLRRRHASLFQSWLDDNREDVRLSGIAGDKIHLTIDRCSDEFISDIVPSIASKFAPNQTEDVVEQLRLFKASGVWARPSFTYSSEQRRDPGVINAIIAAFLGALAGVFLVAPQITISARHLPSLTLDRAMDPATTAEAQSRFLVAANAWIAEATRWLAEVSISLGLASAVGAALGTLIVVSPPLFQRHGIAAAIFSRFGRALRPFFLIAFRRSLLLAGLLLIAFVIALGALLVFAERPAYIAVSILAFIGIVTLRLISDELRNQHGHLRQKAMEALNMGIAEETGALAALCAGLVMRSSEREQSPADLSELKRIILVRRTEGQGPATILPIVEQYLNLPDSSRNVETLETEFLWKRELAARFNTYGVVEEGDMVKVVEEPLLLQSANGTVTVSKKGQVARKAKGSS